MAKVVRRRASCGDVGLTTPMQERCKNSAGIPIPTKPSAGYERPEQNGADKSTRVIAIDPIRTGTAKTLNRPSAEPSTATHRHVPLMLAIMHTLQ